MSEFDMTVVMYHYVRQLDRSRYPEIKGLHVDEFRNQVGYIKTHYNVISMKDVLGAAESGEKLPPRACLLTFDDGYSDHYDFVFPVLFEAGVAAAFYPPRSSALDRKVLDVNKVHFILASAPDKDALLAEIETQMEAARDRFSFPPAAELETQFKVANRFDTATVIYIKRLLQHALPEALRAEITDALFKRFVTADEAAFGEELYMSLGQMRTMAGCGMHFGGHGDKHIWLSRASEAEQTSEIDRATDLLDQIGMSQTERTFCFPYGDYSAVTTRLIAERGYQVAFTSAVGLASMSPDQHLILPRLDANDLPRRSDAAPNSWTMQALQLN